MTEINFPDKGFSTDIKRYRKRKPSVTFVVKRDVVAPMMIRNTSSERAEIRKFEDNIHAQANGEKFVSKERLTGLDYLRKLSDRFGSEWIDALDDNEIPDKLISDSYTYNEPEGMKQTLNLDTVTYGGAGTGDQEFALKSHVYEGYTYTLDEYDIMKKETRNAVFESGTMEDEDKDQSSSLFNEVRIHPGNSFIHFITVESGTPGMFLYVLHNILNTNKYGARGTRAGKTVDNDILGIILSEHDTALSTAEYMEQYYQQEVPDSIGEYIKSEEKTDWDVYSDKLDQFLDYPEWYNKSYSIANREEENADELMYDYLHESTENALKNIIDKL